MDISTRNRLTTELAAARTALSRNQKIYENNNSDRTLENIHRLTDTVELLEKQIADGVLCDVPVDPSELKKLKKTNAKNDKFDLLQEKYKNKYHDFKRDDRSNPRLKDLERSESHIEKATDKLPRHISEKLKTMPNNEGYIYRDVWFMGALPSTSDDITILDTSDRDVMYITKYTYDMVTVYEKKRNEYKKLVSQTPRRGIAA